MTPLVEHTGYAGKPNVSPLLAYTNLQERQKGGVNPSAYRPHIDPLKAYALYGYREGTDWVPDKHPAIEEIPNQDRNYDKSGTPEERYIGAFNVKKRKKENTFVMSTDTSDCAVGSMTVNGQCVPLSDARKGQCPEGRIFKPGYGCIPDHQTKMNIKTGLEKQEGLCLPGWILTKEGDCTPSKEFSNGLSRSKELSTGSDEPSESSPCKMVGIILGVIIIIALLVVFSRAMLTDNGVRRVGQVDLYSVRK